MLLKAKCFGGKKKKDGSFKLGTQNEAKYEILSGRILINRKNECRNYFFIVCSEVYEKKLHWVYAMNGV